MYKYSDFQIVLPSLYVIRVMGTLFRALVSMCVIKFGPIREIDFVSS